MKEPWNEIFAVIGLVGLSALLTSAAYFVPEVDGPFYVWLLLVQASLYVIGIASFALAVLGPISIRLEGYW